MESWSDSKLIMTRSSFILKEERGVMVFWLETWARALATLEEEDAKTGSQGAGAEGPFS